tara:strand:+ start:3950 stop:4213 length:264 start_codon:yes stop_codon:yes gene_type:complete
MSKAISFFTLISVIIFFIITYKYYSSNKNIEEKNYTRKNINEIINAKISNLPILKNDTDNVIEFNDGLSSENNSDKPRSFWNLIKTK